MHETPPRKFLENCQDCIGVPALEVSCLRGIYNINHSIDGPFLRSRVQRSIIRRKRKANPTPCRGGAGKDDSVEKFVRSAGKNE